MPAAPKYKLNYFSGHTDNLPAIYEEIEAWLKETKVAAYQLNSTVSFHVEDRKWYIIITVMYQDSQSVARTVIRPGMLMSAPRRAD